VAAAAWRAPRQWQHGGGGGGGGGSGSVVAAASLAAEVAAWREHNFVGGSSALGSAAAVWGR
jgi:hypothetical protein